MKKYHYTYYSYEEFGRGYIGKRSCKCKPEEDVKYFGTYKDQTFHPTQKIILETYDTAEEAIADEIKLQRFFQVVPNPHFANQVYQTSTKFQGTSETARKSAASKTPEQRREIAKKASATLTPEQRSIISKKIQANITPEQRSIISKKIQASRTPEQRSESAKKRESNKTPKQRSEIARKAAASKTPEQRSNGAKKISNQRFQCTVTGYITNSGGLSRYQKKRGIDRSNRVRIA